ncbi:MAG: ABC transporter ATP-binding protein [Desulfuromonadaceae bacterium]|nr:ABC transporter ATP-binding protein [Desulfuromonadaceae bacterium]
MIRARQISFSYPTLELFHSLDLHIRGGEIFSILGPNGSGKSTLLRILRGVLRPTAGTVLLEGKTLSSWSRRKIARHIAVVSQSEEVHFPYPVADAVAMGRFPHHGLWRENQANWRKEVAEALEWAGITHLARRSVTRLSAGERQKVIIARALAQRTPILFLDEPAAHLDVFQQVELARLLCRLRNEQGKTVVHVSHDINLSAAISDRILLLAPAGELLHQGEPAVVLTERNLFETFGLEMKISRQPDGRTPRIDIPLTRPRDDLKTAGAPVEDAG